MPTNTAERSWPEIIQGTFMVHSGKCSFRKDFLVLMRREEHQPHRCVLVLVDISSQPCCVQGGGESVGHSSAAARP
ncbi:hypothetical protein VZT92_018106 [Zoarces viviparus]|uniref:Uncharacterized protein n=1 Tax=Zoarces viviparus TaxID=48416 RepID=A0AAW1EPU7_ZOAVI